MPVKSIATTMTDKQLTDTLTWLNYTVERTDLPSNYLTCVAIEKGFIKWIGSLNSGVIRFDDRNWTIYDESNSPVPNDIINQLYVDNDQNVWICTNHGVIKKWGDSWTVYDKQNSGIADNRITSVAHGDGKIYFGTMNGLSLLQDGNWTTYKTENSLLPSDQVNAILYQNTNLFWICTDKGLVEIKNNVWTVFSGKPTGFPSNNLRCAAQDIYYKPWFGFKDPGGTAVFIKGNIWTAYAGIPDVNSVAVDKQNIKWFACFGSGIAKLNGNNWTIYNSSNSGLKSDFIFSVATGKNGNKYLASFGAGLIKYKGY